MFDVSGTDSVASHARRLLRGRVGFAIVVAVILAAWLVNIEAQGTWATDTSLPSAIQEVSVTALNNLVYVVGGSVNQVRSNATQIFTPSTHAWSSAAPYPGAARDHMSLVALNGFLYLIGGLTAWPQPAVTTVQRYDPNTNTWTALAPLPVARGAGGAVAINGKIYFAGGLEAGVDTADFTVYDPAANTWTALPSMPTARDHVVAATVNGLFYAIGGNNPNLSCGLKTVEVYNPTTNTWSSGPSLLVGHAAVAVGQANGHIQIFGGDGNAVNCGVQGDSEDFDPVANAWSQIPDMPTPRHGTGGATINNSVYIPGGATASGDAATAVNERFDALAQTLPTGWTDQDIGSVGLTGGASFNNGVFTVEGEGSDIWGTADSFNFAWQTLNGDGQIVARVTSVENTNTYAKAGVMIRSALTAGAQDVILDVKPGGGLEFMSRSTSGGSTAWIAGGTGSAPVWLKLVRSGSTITGYSSPDGSTWATIGTTSVAMASPASIGLAVCSHSSGFLNTAAFDNVTVTQSSGGGGGTDAAPVVSIASPTSGATFTAGGNITITANATDTDSTPVAKVDFYANNGTTNTLIGTDTASPYTFTWTNVAAGSYSLTAVATDTANLSTTSAAVAITVSSTGGGGGGGGALPTPWADTDIGSVGLAGSASYNSGTFTVNGAGADVWGTADSFNFVNQLANGNTQITARVVSLTNTNTFAKAGVMLRGGLTAGAADVILDVKPGGGLEFMSRATSGGSTTWIAGATNSAPVWVRLVLSGSTVTGYASADGATWTTVGTTSVTLGTSPYMGLAVCSHTTSQLMTATFDNVTVGGSSGGGGTDAAPVVSITSPTNGATFTAGGNITITANATDTDSTPVAKVDFYANNGTTNTLIGTDTASPYTFSWTNVAAGSYSLTAVATDTANLSTTSAAVAVTVSSTGGGGGGGALPTPWADTDIGSVGLAGSASYNSGTFTVNGAGADVWGTADSFNFVNQLANGNTQITARVVSLTNTNTFAKAGVMLRGGLTAGAADVILDVKPGGGLEFMSRATSGGSTTWIAGATNAAPVWVRLVLSGSTVTGYASADGATWTTVGTTSVTLGTSPYMGLAVCSHTTSQLMTATFDNVTVSGSSGGGGTDAPPVVTITSPTNGATFTAGGSITITANATDTDSTPVAKVDFYANNGTTNTLIGTDTASPYTFSWTNVAAGSYSLTAVATDTANLSTTSTPVSITVSSTGGGGGGTLLDTDVGNVGLAGSASFSNGTYTVSGAGSDIWGTADSFNFAYQTLTGDGQITARVTGITNTNQFAKAGVQIRQSLSPSDVSVTLDLIPNGGGAAGGGLEMLTRSSNGGSTVVTQGAVAFTPMYVKLVRSGTTITGYVSSDGNGWSVVNSTTISSLTGTVYVGLAVCSHNTSVLNTSTFDNVAVGNTATVTNAISFSTKVLAATSASGSAVGIANLNWPTVVVLGPDGRLYVSNVNGRLFVLTLDQTKLTQAGQVAVTNVQEIDTIYNHPSLTCNVNNQPFNCQPSTTPGRQVTGMTFDPASTATNLILYVSNSNYSTTTTSMAIDTYSGTITRLVLQPSGSGNTLNVASNQDLVVGLPRSRESHATNGVRVGPDGWLYIAQGGNTNAGQPSSFFLNLPEYYLGASVLRLNLKSLPSTLPIDMHNATASTVSPYKGVFEIYSTGYRNPYDLAWHSNGNLFINVNSPNQTQGLTPDSADGCSTTPSIDVGTPSDYLRLVTQGSYGGHPNPARGECVWGDGTVYSPAQPKPSNYVAPVGIYVRGWGDSSDGITEYTSNAFSGAMQGNLITATYDTDNHVRRVILAADGKHVNGIFELPNVFTAPVSVCVDKAGNIYVADLTANQITLLIAASPGQ